MSFREKVQPLRKNPLKRSFSFGGFLNSKSLTSPSASGTPVLGAGRTTGVQKKSSGFGFSFSKKNKISKVPRPQRVLMMFEHLKNGIQ